MILTTATLAPWVSTLQSARKWMFGIEVWKHLSSPSPGTGAS
jgi:hypothetical protein